MIDFTFHVSKTVDNCTVRQYSDRAAFQEQDPDTGYLLACKVCDALDALLRSLEDDEQTKKELLRTVRDHVGGRIL